MKSLVALLAMVFSLNAWSECPAERPGKSPVVPKGEVASEEAMYSAQNQTKAFVASVESYLDCRSRSLSSVKRDMLAAKAIRAADNYNAELRAYRSKQNLIASS
ncbi:MAG: hypothetical protein ABJ056_09005 [Halioglobus sp.]